MQPVSRRQFLRISSLAAAATLATACVETVPTPAPTMVPPAEEPTPVPPPAEKPTAAPTKEPTAVPASRYSEAPMLADLVAAGELPPVDERLPENPDVVAPVESIGKYGGTWRRGFRGMSDRWGPTKLKANNLLWYTLDVVLRPALVESWDISEDASHWTFHLRKGMKWSDGVDFTSEAFRWFYDHQVSNPDITPAIPNELATGSPKILCELDTPDDATVVFRFADPNPLFGYTMAGHWYKPFCPGHYMSQFHMELTEEPDKLADEVTAAGFDSWAAYYLDRNAWYLNPDRPTTDPWMATSSLSSELFIMKRNPYFWQVDTQLQQLPYIDTVSHRLYDSPEVFTMWVVNGEIDCQGRGVGMGNYTLFKENEDAGDYHMVFNISAGHSSLEVNLTVKDPRLREFFQDRRVRIAMSHAVNREEINELVNDGLGTPRQYSPVSVSPNYHEELSRAYVEYDPDKARQLLDEAGYTEVDSEGFRLHKDGSGETLSFIIEGTAEQDDTVLMVIRYLADVGIKATYKYDERSLYEVRCAANDVQASSWGGNRTILPIIDPGIWLGTMGGFPWANAWGIWKTNPADPNAEEPPEGHWIWDIWNTWDQVAAEPDEQTRNTLFAGILDIWARELPMMGFVGELPALVVVKNGLHNYPGGYPDENALSSEHFLQGQFLYWDEPKKHV